MQIFLRLFFQKGYENPIYKNFVHLQFFASKKCWVKSIEIVTVGSLRPHKLNKRLIGKEPRYERVAKESGALFGRCVGNI